MPPWRSPTALTLERSTPMVTSVWAISEDRPVMITLAPISREASTVWTRWLATVESIVGTPVMSITTTRAVGADAPQQLLGELAGPLAVQHADDRQDEQPLAHLEDRRGELADGLLLLAYDALALLDEVHAHGVG